MTTPASAAPCTVLWNVDSVSCDITGNTAATAFDGVGALPDLGESRMAVIGVKSYWSLTNGVPTRGKTVNIVESAGSSTLGDYYIDIDSTGNWKTGATSTYNALAGILSSGTHVNARNLVVNITSPSGMNKEVMGIRVWGGGTLTAENFDTNLVYDHDKIQGSSNEAYGIQVGTGLSSGGWGSYANEPTSKVTINNVTNINLTNTANSIRLTSEVANLSGIQVRPNGPTGKGITTDSIFESGNQVNINVYNSSSDETARFRGIHVFSDSEKSSKAILQNANVTIGRSSNGTSAALQVGNIGVDDLTAEIQAQGKLLIDTTADSRTIGILTASSNATVIANYANSSSEIKTSGTAIALGSTNQGYSNMSVLLKDSKISTTNNLTAGQAQALYGSTDNYLPLITAVAGSASRPSSSSVTLTGDNTTAVASDYGYLISAQRDANLTFNASDNGYMTGLSNITMNTAGTAPNNSVLNVNLADGFTWNLNEVQAAAGGVNTASTTASLTNLNLSNQAVLNGAYDNAGNNNYTVKAVNTDGSMGTVTNDNSIINLYNTGASKYNDTLTIDGNYVASGNAVVYMNTLWNAPGDAAVTGGNDSVSDVLHITGTASGTTTVVPVGTGTTAVAVNRTGTLNHIDGTLQPTGYYNTLPVVIVDNDSGAAKFVGTASMDDINEVQLTYRAAANAANANRREYYWTYNLKPIVPIGIAATRINQEQGFTTLSTFHERRGDNMPMLWDSCGCVDGKAENQTWGRIFGERLNLDGKYRVNSRTNQYGIQLGHDWRLDNTENGTRRWVGVYAAYNRGNSDIYDRYRTVNGFVTDDKYVGGVHSNHVSLGLTHTRYRPNGSYLDLVGQFSWVNNKLSARDGKSATQNGVAAVLSAEVGRPYMIGDKKPNESKWVIEPQAQLSYSLLHLNKATFDAQNVVASGNHNGLRGRIGARLSHYSQNGHFTNTFYGIANIYADLLNSSKATFGTTDVKEKYNRVWGELGVGLDLPTSKHGHVYADIRAQRHLGGSAERTAYRGTIGYKYTW